MQGYNVSHPRSLKSVETRSYYKE